MEITIYNTLSSREDVFTPSEEGRVRMYVCGPTVYDLLHIGNFRGAIFFNLVRNWLEHKGMEVTYVYNYTDVDDKIIKRAQDEGVESSVISERYIAEFERDFSMLGLKKHDHNPKVTDFMPQIISFVEDLVKSGNAYVIDGEVFYSVDAFPEYGKLSGKKLEDLIVGERVEEDKRKKNPADFVLWKPSKDGEPKWNSPWGEGRPGWHIECSAMIQSILGETIDIHGGGIDLIFPHHENEVAQGEGRTKKNYCRYWMHNNFINLQEQKMSKSLGNVVTARSFMEQYHPEILKYAILSTHYRSILSINEERIENVTAALARIYHALADAEDILAGDAGEPSGSPSKEFASAIDEGDKAIAESLCQDFNTGKALSHIFEVVRTFNRLLPAKKRGGAVVKANSHRFKLWVKEYGALFSLFQLPPVDFLKQLDDILLRHRKIDRKQVESLVALRLQAREERDWQKADDCRDQLVAMGIELHDGTAGTTWEVKKS